MELTALNMTEIEGLKERPVIIPLGSIEEHGPHLPLGTDILTAIALTKEVAKETDALLAPPIYYGVCRSTKEHPGTIGISPRALRLLIKDVVKSFVLQGFSRFLLFSGHAGSLHMAALKEAGEELIETQKIKKMAICSILDLIDEEMGLVTQNDSHAGELETSLIAYLYPQMVKGSAKEEYPQFPPFMIVKNKRNFWPGGVWGNPQVASKEKGGHFFRSLVRKLVKIVDSVKD